MDFTAEVAEIELAITEGVKLLTYGYVPVPDPPSTYRALRSAYALAKPLPVLDLDVSPTIYSDHQFNIMLRAWHDHLHVTLGKSFLLAGELAVTKAHCKALTTPRARALMYYETYGQVSYWYKHHQYVPNQRQWVFDQTEKYLNAVGCGGLVSVLGVWEALAPNSS